MKLFTAKGTKKGSAKLPKAFSTAFRPDVIKRAVLAEQSWRRQAYGPDKMAGKKTSAHYHGRRSLPHSQRMMNREMARVPRIHGDEGRLFMTARIVPQAVKGRRAHPPKPERKWKEKVNRKERILALKSAISATADPELVKKRGHKAESIVVDGLEKIEKTKDLVKLLKKTGFEEEMKRCSKKKVRPGKGKMRGRKYKRKKGPLVVTAKELSVKNIPGVDVVPFHGLTVEMLAPGCDPGRVTIWSKEALKKLSEVDKNA